MENKMKINFEMTDTFGGESNYSWVRRESFNAPDNTSNRAIVRRAKQWADISGVRSRVENYGDMISIWPNDRCHVVFVTFGD